MKNGAYFIYITAEKTHVKLYIVVSRSILCLIRQIYNAEVVNHADYIHMHEH